MYDALCVLVCGYGLAMVGWMVMFGIGLIEVAGNLGFDIPLLTSCVDFQTHVSMMPCVCLCLGMVLPWLVGW